MKTYYVETGQDLYQILAERKKQSKEIERRVNDCVEEKYGIKDFLSLTEKILGHTSRAGTTAMLLRQVSSVSVEEVTCHLAARALGMPLINLSLANDGYNSMSLDKVSRVKIPWISWSLKGNMMKKFQYIGKESPKYTEKKALGRIETTVPGIMLQEYHHNLRKSLFENNYFSFDCSNLFKKYFWDCTKNKPDFVTMIKETGYLEKISAADVKEVMDIKPPAAWYYNLYYLWFLTGKYVIFETYDDPGENQNASVRHAFETTMDTINNEIGVYPIVVKIMPAREEIFYCNSHLDKAGLKKLEAETDLKKMVDNIKFPDFFHEIAKTVIRYS